MSKFDDILSHHRYLSTTIDGIVSLLQCGKLNDDGKDILDKMIDNRINTMKFNIEMFLKALFFRRLEIYYSPVDDGDYSSYKKHMYKDRDTSIEYIHVALTIEATAIDQDTAYAVCKISTDDETSELRNKPPVLVSLGSTDRPECGDDATLTEVLLDFLTGCISLSKAYYNTMKQYPNNNILFISYKHISNVNIGPCLTDWADVVINKELNLLYANMIKSTKETHDVMIRCKQDIQLRQSDLKDADGCNDPTPQAFIGGIINLSTKLFTGEDDVTASIAELYIHDERDKDLGVVNGVPNYVKLVIKYVDNTDDDMGKIAVVYLCHNKNKKPIVIDNLMALPHQMLKITGTAIAALAARTGVDPEELHLVADIKFGGELDEFDPTISIVNDDYYIIDDDPERVMHEILSDLEVPDETAS